MSDRPLTPLMLGILRVLATGGVDQPMTPNHIGWLLPDKLKPERWGHARTASGGKIGIGSLLRSPLVALEKRGLIKWCPRRDGLSGSAYYITSEGRSVLRSTTGGGNG